MKDIIIDLTTFFNSLSLYDYLFLLSIMVLFIMIVSLIYIFKINREEDFYDDGNDGSNDSVDEELDLIKLSKDLGEKKSKNIELNEYEREQEEKAIISYDELLAVTSEISVPITYKKEENLDGLLIRAVDLDMFNTKPIELPKMKEEVSSEEKIEESISNNKSTMLISYEKEEAFLESLKNLKGLLN